MEKVQFPYRIKKKFPYLRVYTVVGTIMLILSLIFLFSPFIPLFSDAMSDSMEKVYMVIGGVCTPFFAFSVCYSLLNITSPTDGIIINEKGFHERTMADGGVGFVPAEAIISLKLFGNKNKKFLGIRIEQDYMEKIGKSKKAKREIYSNVESGMPAIIIRECDISVSARELLELLLTVYSPTEKKPVQDNVESDIVNIAEAEDAEASVDTGYFSEDNNDDVISIDELPVDDDRKAINDNDGFDDLPITIEEEPDKPHIKNVDELLSHLLKNNKTDGDEGEKE